MARNNDLRSIIYKGDIALVPLTKGLFATIDADAAPLVSGHNWVADASYGRMYANRMTRLGGRHRIYMHRLMIGAERGQMVDHIDGDSLNNRRLNLRLATHHENMRNVGLGARNRTGFKGVHLYVSSGKWRSQIRTDEGRVSLGLFDTPEAAYEAYREAALKLHGEFAKF